MRLGLQLGLTNISPKPLGDYLIDVAERADQAGFATLVVADHFSLRPGGPFPMLAPASRLRRATLD